MLGDVCAQKCSKTGTRTHSILEKFVNDTTLCCTFITGHPRHPGYFPIWSQCQSYYSATAIYHIAKVCPKANKTQREIALRQKL